MMKTDIPWRAAALLLVMALGADKPPDLVIEVDAGAHNRHDTLVRLALPEGLHEVGKLFALEDVANKTRVPVEREGNSIIWALNDPLPARAKRRYRLTLQSAPEHGRPQSPALSSSPSSQERPGNLEFSAHAGIFELKRNNRTVFAYHEAIAEPPQGIDRVFRRSGFIHPLATRAGVVVTDDFPPDHAHQHGVFFAWVNTTFEGRHVDFWNQMEGTGLVGHASIGKGLSFGSGPVAAMMRAALEHDDLTAPGGPVKVLDETWQIVTYDIPGLVVLDFESVQNCAGAKPLILNKYNYGGFAVRGNRQWFDPAAEGNNPPAPARSGQSDFLTSDGKHRHDGNHTRPRWVDLSGEVDGRWAGVTVLDHPANFRFPQPVRLHPNKPYFCFAPMVLGEFAIKPGTPYVSRYRLIAHDGPPDVNVIERLWNDYADPPRASVVAP